MGASDSRLPPASARAAGRLQSRETAVASLNSFIQQTLNEDQHIRKACMSNQPQCPSQASRVELALSSLEVRWLEKFRSVGLFYSFFKIRNLSLREAVQVVQGHAASSKKFTANVSKGTVTRCSMHPAPIFKGIFYHPHN
ncbi:uncharacterized protein LOC144382717 isoform X1 [Halichoerus grypus]